ncbi:hypothetical protein L6R53_32270 [Myxococcota bacterium]|nr:hypothetical protein [Myxococcota bacterium]
MLLLSGCWQYLEPGLYGAVDGRYLPENYWLYNQAPFFLLEESQTWFRVAVLESSRSQVGLAFLLYRYDPYSYDQWFDYSRLDYGRSGDDVEEPNFVLCDRRDAQFVCKTEENGRTILGRVNSHDSFTLFGSGSESAEGTVVNDLMISFTYEFSLLDDISGGEDLWGQDIFTQGDWKQLESDFDHWMDR